MKLRGSGWGQQEMERGVKNGNYVNTCMCPPDKTGLMHILAHKNHGSMHRVCIDLSHTGFYSSEGKVDVGFHF